MAAIIISAILFSENFKIFNFSRQKVTEIFQKMDNKNVCTTKIPRNGQGSKY